MSDIHENYPLVTFGASQQLPAERFAGIDELIAAATKSAGSPVPILEALTEISLTSWEEVQNPILATWELLATISSIDLAAARTLEPHLDALSILREADRNGAGIPLPEGSTWGVFAAEAPDARLTAAETADGWILEGTKSWCSLAGHLSHAIVTAWIDDTRRSTFAVDLRHPGVSVASPHQWHAVGLRNIVSGPITLRDVPALPVGAPEWYLKRPNFAAGGIGVAACWFGGAVGLFRTLRNKAAQRTPDQIALARLGLLDRHLAAAAASLLMSSQRAESGGADWREAHRTRGTVEEACRVALAAAAESLGPAALAFDEEHARRVADLELYIRQHHGARDDAALGELSLAEEHVW